MMLNKILTTTIVIVFTVTGLVLAEYSKSYVFRMLNMNLETMGITANVIAAGLSLAIGVLLFGGLGYLLAPIIVRYMMNISELLVSFLTKLPTEQVVAAAIGAIVGLVLASLLGISFSNLPIVGPYIPIALSIVCTIVGVKVALHKSTDIFNFVNKVFPKAKEQPKEQLPAVVYCNHKILDTSVLIDGRIADIVRTGFLDGPLVIPTFVLEELQKIADSADNLKRNRGRRGLDIVRSLQDEHLIEIMISEKDFPETPEVDNKLLLLAKELDGVVATNDFNLGKVAEIQGVRILNINDLANALKPAVLPGEHMNVFVAKEGKEHGQGIAYLEDGTMVVVENGKQAVNRTVDVVVTSVLQTSAGRMIFAKSKG